MNTTTTTNPFSLPLPASAPASARSGLRLLQRLQHGTLHLELPDGSTLQVGQGAGQGGYPHASLHLHHWRVFGAVLRSGDIGLAEGYIAQVIAPWGEAIGHPSGQPAFRWDGSNSAADQALQMGMHHDGMAFFPLEGSRRGLLVMNHEYADHGLLFKDGGAKWGPEQVAKSQAAHGFSVIEIAQQPDGSWALVKPSRYARRVTASTPHAVVAGLLFGDGFE